MSYCNVVRVEHVRPEIVAKLDEVLATFEEEDVEDRIQRACSESYDEGFMDGQGSCEDNHNEMAENASMDGYREGHEEGYKEGFDAGHEAGYEDGRDEGFNDGSLSCLSMIPAN